MDKKNFLFGFIILIFIGLIFILIFNVDKRVEGTLTEINYVEISEMVDNKEDFILVVSQSTCSHCATYRPKVQKIAKEYGINIYYIDYDNENSKNQDKFLKEFDLDGATPTTVFIKDGKEISKLSRLIGDLSETKIVTQFKKMGFIEE